MKWTLACVVLSCALTAISASAEQNEGLSYKGINIQLGGFLASEMVYRNNNMGSDIGTPFASIPFSNGAGYGMTEFRGSERQSRFSLLAHGENEGTKFSGYYELDFLGTSGHATPTETNSYTPRTRHVYMVMDWEDSGWHLLAGQTWSLATLNNHGITPRSEYIPQTIDAQYEVGFNWARQWQLRLTKDWNKTYWAALSLENAQTMKAGGALNAGTGNTLTPTVSGGGALTGANMDAALSFNGYPDVVAKFAAETGVGHYEVYGLMRDFQSRFGPGGAGVQTSKQDVWTEAVGAGAVVPVVPGMLDLAVSGLTGKGIGRYGTSQLSDTTFAIDGSLAPLNGTQYLAQLTWHAHNDWDIYVGYGEEAVSSSGNAAYGYGDGVIATNAGCTAGYTTAVCTPLIKNIVQYNVGAWWTFYKGTFGATKLGLQYSHTSLNTFADATGIAPTTNEDIAFTSLRYYPF